MQQSLKVTMFTGSHCGNCKMIKPKLAQLCKELNIQLSEVDIDTSDGLERAQQLGVRQLPFILLEQDSIPYRSCSGMQSPTKLREFLTV